MIERRAFALSTAGFIVSRNSFAQSAVSPTKAVDDDLPPLPKELEGAASENDFFSVQLGNKPLGTADPGEAKKKFAREIMEAAPKNCRPIDVAYFYRKLGKGETVFKEEGRPYARGWPRLYNPLIIQLFQTTGVDPLSPKFQGDETPWCAAFINYCIARAVSKDGRIDQAALTRGTRSASSGSFRCFGSAIQQGNTPKEGDIAVWALEGTIDGCKSGKGHVGFYSGATGDPKLPYFVMGGNQGGDLITGVDTRKDGMFLKAMPLTYIAQKNPPKYKKFFGFRTTAYL